MKKYFEIYPMEVASDKIHRMLEEVKNASPNMYDKTRERYANLAVTMLNSVDLITSILEESTLDKKDSGEDEFQTMRNDYIQKIDEAYTNMGLCKLDTYVQLHMENELGISHPSKLRFKNTENDNHVAITTFDYVLSEASLMDFGYEEINQCAKLMYAWFSTRFNKYCKDFRYNIRYLPDWVAYFIICYGKYMNLKQSTKFSEIITKWCKNILNKKNSTYALPKEIYELMKSSNNLDYTMEAVMIYDIMSENILYKLFSDEFENEIHLEYNTVTQLVKKYNRSLESKIRTRQSRHIDILKDLDFTPTGGSLIE